MSYYYLLQRILSNDKSTISVLHRIDAGDKTYNRKFICFIIEDQFQAVKVYGETRIPVGDYKIKLRDYNSTLHEKFKKRFSFHKGMLEIKGIPNFTNVYFHPGNNDDETLGCPLTGYSVEYNMGEDRYEITGGTSTPAYVDFYKGIILDLLRDGSISLRVVDLDLN